MAPSWPFALRLAGADGGVVSGGGGGVDPGTGIWTIDPTDGTPWSSFRNTMYHPGGAMLASAGALTVSWPVPRVKLRNMNRWS